MVLTLLPFAAHLLLFTRTLFLSLILVYDVLFLQKSTWKVLPRSIQMHIMKENDDEGFWERLLKASVGLGRCDLVTW